MSAPELCSIYQKWCCVDAQRLALADLTYSTSHGKFGEHNKTSFFAYDCTAYWGIPRRNRNSKFGHVPDPWTRDQNDSGANKILRKLLVLAKMELATRPKKTRKFDPALGQPRKVSKILPSGQFYAQAYPFALLPGEASGCLIRNQVLKCDTF